MHTVERDGFLIEEGATILSRSYTSILGVARDAGLGDEVVPAAGLFGFVGADGAVHEIDIEHILRSGLTTKLVRHLDKLRMLRVAAEVLRYRRRFDVEDLSLLSELDVMSADAYGRRLMGDELFDNIGDACVRTLVGCASSEVSAVDLLFVFGQFLTGSSFVAFRGGMQSYVELLAERCRFDVQLGAEVVDVHERADRVDVRWRDASGSETVETADGVVLACDANVVSRIHRGIDDWRRTFLRDGVRFSCMPSCAVATERAPEVDYSYVFPSAKAYPGMPFIGLEHSKVPGRAPLGKGLVSLFPPSDVGSALYDEPDDVVAKTLIEAAEPAVPGLADSVLFTHVSRARPCVMQSRPGYWKSMREFRSRSAEADGRIRLAGDYFCVSNTNNASAAGERAARELVAELADR